jgi:hypothetical protein
MTRFLSESLQAEEPFFRQALKRLEAATGHNGTDIRLSAEIMHGARRKALQLGLDPCDTTAQELYRAVEERLRQDDQRLVKALRTLAATHISAEGDVIAGMVHAINELPMSKRCFALKQSSFKTIIRRMPPKKAMKKLGYRSVDSFLKHESPAAILTAAALTEDSKWQHKLHESYRKLRPNDFETRNIQVVTVSFKRWQDIANEVVAEQRHNLLTFKELGAVVLLPFPASTPAGAVTASLTLALHSLNDIRATASYLKLGQVRSDFGQLVQEVAGGEPSLKEELMDKAVPWHLAHSFYSQFKQHFNEAAFEPHISLEDLEWHPVERLLSTIEPVFEFWHDTAHLAMLHGREAVSFNLLDAALSHCNGLAFEHRVTSHFRESLWQQLLQRYLQPSSLEQTILQTVHPQLAAELAPA